VAGPSTGSAAVPTCRALVVADLPVLSKFINFYVPTAAASSNNALTGSFLAESAYTITQFNVFSLNGPATCATNMIFQLYDTTAAAYVSGIATTISANHDNLNDALSVTLTAQHVYRLGEPTAYATCGTIPSNLAVAIGYH
jgi:hypothetical protein